MFGTNGISTSVSDFREEFMDIYIYIKENVFSKGMKITYKIKKN